MLILPLSEDGQKRNNQEDVENTEVLQLPPLAGVDVSARHAGLGVQGKLGASNRSVSHLVQVTLEVMYRMAERLRPSNE
jgi:hypothetical protein